MSKKYDEDLELAYTIHRIKMQTSIWYRIQWNTKKYFRNIIYKLTNKNTNKFKYE